MEVVLIGEIGFRAISVIAALEEDLSVPILAGNQVAFWYAFHRQVCEPKSIITARCSEKAKQEIGRCKGSIWHGCCQSTWVIPARSHGAGRSSTRPCGSSRWREGAWFGGSTSMVTHRVIWPVTVASNDAVFVYQMDSYRYWQGELKRHDSYLWAIWRKLHCGGPGRQ